MHRLLEELARAGAACHLCIHCWSAVPGVAALPGHLRSIVQAVLKQCQCTSKPQRCRIGMAYGITRCEGMVESLLKTSKRQHL